MKELWIIEARNDDGSLNLKAPQPDEFFGMDAIHGMTADNMAKTIFRKLPDAHMRGDSISIWPRLIHSAWIARRKIW